MTNPLDVAAAGASAGAGPVGDLASDAVASVASEASAVAKDPAKELSRAGDAFKIFNLTMPLDEVVFDLNPSSFKVTKAVISNNKSQTGKPATGTASAKGYVNLYRGTQPTVISFTAMLTEESSGPGAAVKDATAVGGGVKARCDMLLQWTQPGGGSMLSKLVGLATKSQIVAAPPVLTLQWGDPARGFFLQGTLTRITITYLRFDSTGNPIPTTGFFDVFVELNLDSANPLAVLSPNDPSRDPLASPGSPIGAMSIEEVGGGFPVPEPASLALLLAGSGLGLGFRRRR